MLSLKLSRTDMKWSDAETNLMAYWLLIAIKSNWIWFHTDLYSIWGKNGYYKKNLQGRDAPNLMTYFNPITKFCKVWKQKKIFGGKHLGASLQDIEVLTTLKCTYPLAIAVFRSVQHLLTLAQKVSKHMNSCKSRRYIKYTYHSAIA